MRVLLSGVVIAAFAAQVLAQDLEALKKKADIIVVGQVVKEEMFDAGQGPGMIRRATVMVKKVIKGAETVAEKQTIVLSYIAFHPAYKINHLRKGREYLFFLKRGGHRGCAFRLADPNYGALKPTPLLIAKVTGKQPPLPEDVLPFFWNAKDKRFVNEVDVLCRELVAAKAVFAGEFHASVGAHAMQLWVLKTLAAAGKKVVVAVEWFQQPYQKALDDYLKGKTDEKTMLEATQFKKRWGYDWAFFKQIIEFCRKNGIKVYAANVPSELSHAVAQNGLKNIPENLKKWLPKQMDTSNATHRKYVEKRFEPMLKQGILTKERLDSFYEAQVLWDEVFAEQAARALKESGADTVVLFAGAAHLGHRAAVPNRFHQRTNITPLVLLPCSANTPLKKIVDTTVVNCDYLFFTRR
ncbi:MAG: hypothetical protein DRP63_00020 [Planctomycetota bacterium]|nr:MAG: hypothetical protein DRP63_00020 [Planctomycetota bacterium]